MPCSRGALAAFASLLAASFFIAPAGLADTSAADKAAARQVATEGIQLFKTQKYEGALDRMRRAQALYDAPVHLLYMARAEEKLGLLVESSEHYRQLDRYTLPPNPPEAWTAAVDDGRKELAAVEPRVPKLRVLTEPAVSNASLRIDGAGVSSAAVGIPRPINPGKHRVELATPGREWSTAEVDVAEGTTRDVVFRMQPGAGAAPTVTTGVVASTPPRGEGTGASAGAVQREEPFVGFLAGLRLGGAVPTGQLFGAVLAPAEDKRDIEMSEVAQPGGFLEFQAGLRLGRYFTPVFFLSGQTLGHPSTFQFGGLGSGVEIKSASAASFGIGVRFGTPPGKIGAFGEFDIGVLETLTVGFQGQNADECKIDARGSSLRLGGGIVIPVVKWLQITPLAVVSIGRFTDREAKGCPRTVTLSKEIPSDDQLTHGMILLGVGGDLLISGRR